MNSQDKMKNVDSITGLRAVAMIAVMCYHLFPNIMPGGFLGVVVFFVVSGFFFTRKLYNCLERDGKLSYGELIFSRVKRLYGPLVFMLSVVLLWSYFLQPAVFRDGYGEVFPILFGYDNIAQINRQLSYFDMHGLFRPFVHLWALSIEMQFYFLYPFLFGILNRVFKRNVKLINFVLLILAFCSAYAMRVKYQVGIDPSRVYYGTDTRLFSFFIGAFFAGTCHVRKAKSTNAGHVLLELLTGAAVIAGFFTIDSRSEALYRYGFFAYSVVTGIFLKMLVEHDGFFGILYIIKPLKAIGRRSYSIYLFQYPVQVLFMEYFSHRIAGDFERIWLQIPVFMLLSEVSYRLFEVGSRSKRSYKKIAAIAIMTFALLVIPYKVDEEVLKAQSVKDAITRQEEKLAEDALREEKERRIRDWENLRYQAIAFEIQEKREWLDMFNSQHSGNSIIDQKINIPKVKMDSLKRNLDEENKKKLSDLYDRITPINEKYDFAKLEYDDLIKLRNISITAVGDSVLLMAESDLRQFFPTAVVDTKVSRQLPAGVDLLNNIKHERGLNDVVVISLGTNGDFDYKWLESLNEIRGDRPMVVVNTVMPDPWEKSVNDKLYRMVEENDDIVLVDWYIRAKSNGSIFYDDRTHPMPEGALLYAQMIAKAISEMR